MFSFHFTVYLSKTKSGYSLSPNPQNLSLNARGREQKSLCTSLSTQTDLSLPEITFGTVNSAVAQLLCKVIWTKQEINFHNHSRRKERDSRTVSNKRQQVCGINGIVVLLPRCYCLEMDFESLPSFHSVSWPGLNSSHVFIFRVSG